MSLGRSMSSRWRTLQRILLSGERLLERGGDAALGNKSVHGNRAGADARQRELRPAAGHRSRGDQQCHRIEQQSDVGDAIRHTHLQLSGRPSGLIQPNAAVPYVNCFAYSNGQGSWTTICFNNNLTTAESVTLTGPGAPTGAVSETIFPEQGNVITDHNEDTFLGAASSAPVVAAPTASSASGATYSVPPASFIALTYTAGGTSTLAPPTFSPGSGTYPGTQTVTISFPPGSTGCVGINTTPSAPTAGTCGAGGTTYTGPITVSSSETVNAIATQAGSSNSAVATATYTINLPAAAAPVFSPASGTYTGAQTVTISTATPGATIYYTTDGTTPTTSSSVYSGPITVSSSETLEAIAAATGYTQSAVATAKYTINSGGAIRGILSRDPKLSLSVLPLPVPA